MNTRRAISAFCLLRTVGIVLFTAAFAAPTYAAPLIVANTAGCLGGLRTYDFAGGSLLNSFSPDGSNAGGSCHNGRGVAISGTEIFYTELTTFIVFGPTDSIRVAPSGVNGSGGADVRTLPNPRPAAGIQDLAFSRGSLYALTGYGYSHNIPLQVFKLDPTTGTILAGPISIAGPASNRSNGFTVLPNGNFLINDAERIGPIYREYDSVTGALVAGGLIIDLTSFGFTEATGVDITPDGTTLYFVAFDPSNHGVATFVHTDLLGNFIASQLVSQDPNFVFLAEDIALFAPGCASDTDGDGVCDTVDSCPGTPPGEIVDAPGCSCSQKTCNDGNACTIGDTCSDGQCMPGTPVVCTALDQCHDAGTCDPQSGKCSQPTKADGTSCDDGDLCNGVATCDLNGQCQPGTPPSPGCVSPLITSVTPKSGNAGTGVKIKGHNFGTVRANSRVFFGATVAAVQTWSDTVVLAIAPRLPFGDVGAASVTIRVDAGTSNFNQFFTYIISTRICKGYISGYINRDSCKLLQQVRDDKYFAVPTDLINDDVLKFYIDAHVADLTALVATIAYGDAVQAVITTTATLKKGERGFEKALASATTFGGYLNKLNNALTFLGQPTLPLVDELVPILNALNQIATFSKLAIAISTKGLVRDLLTMYIDLRDKPNSDAATAFTSLSEDGVDQLLKQLARSFDLPCHQSEATQSCPELPNWFERAYLARMLAQDATTRHQIGVAIAQLP